MGEIDRVVNFAHVNDRVCTGWMESDVDGEGSADFENDAVGFGNGEAGARNLQVVGAYFEGGEDVETFCVGQCLARNAPGLVGGCYLSRNNSGSLKISYFTVHCAAWKLTIGQSAYSDPNECCKSLMHILSGRMFNQGIAHEVTFIMCVRVSC